MGESFGLQQQLFLPIISTGIGTFFGLGELELRRV
jgi:hypothetical protein